VGCSKDQRQFIFKHDVEELVHCAGRVEFVRGHRGGEKAQIVRSKSRVTKLFVTSHAGVVGGALLGV